MRVRSKLITMTLFVAVVPLAVSAFQSVRIHERALESTLLQLHGKSALFGASLVGDYFYHARASLRTMLQETITWNDLSRDESEGALWLAYGQLKSSALVQLKRGGRTQQQVYLSRVSDQYPEHAPLTPEDIEEFERVVPPASELGVIGAPVRTGSGATLVPIALSDRERGEPSALTFAVGLNLASLCQRLVEVKPERGEIALFDRWNRAVCSTRGAPALQSADPELRGFLLPGSGNYQRQVEGQRFRGTVAAVLDGWRVVVEQPQDVISSPTLVLRNRALLWLCIGAAAAVASGLILSGSIYRPLQLLTAGVREIGTGNLGFRLQTASNDEFAQLARAFNTMSQGIAERDAEIREWNAKLQARVEKRGKQLKAAQDALLRSQKMAGLSTLVAGVAHEMNNPLTGILGLSQVLWGRGRKQGTDSSELELLGSIVTEAKRMQRLLSRMQALSDTVNTEDFREVKVGRLLDGVLLAARARMRELGIELFVDFKHGQATVLGDQYQLNQVFHGIVDNSLKAMTDQGGTLSVSTSSPDGDWIVITVSDTGHGIKEEQLEKVIEPFFTTKQGGAGDGLGLSLTYQAVRAHGGNLEVRSEWGKGTEVEVRLPAIRVGAHLA